MKKLAKVFEQTSWQVFGKFITSAATFVTLSLIARNYGKEEVGVYTLSLTYLAMFFIVSDLGLNAYVITQLTNDKDQANKLFNARLYLSIFLAVFAIALSFLLPLGSEIFKLAVVMGAISILGNGIFTSSNLIFQHHLRYDRSIIASSAGAILTALIIFGMVYLKLPVYILVSATAIGWILNGLLAVVLVKGFYHFKLLPLDLKYFLDLIKKVWPVSLTLILNVIYFRFDGFILAATRTLADVGIYNLSFTLFQAALVVATFIMNAYYPIILKEANQRAFFKQIKNAFFIMIAISLVGTILTFLLSGPTIDLMGGGKFPESVTSLNILAISFPAFFGSALLMWVMVSKQMYKSLLYIYTIGLVINVVLNLLLAPEYSYLASSWITVAGEYLILFMQLGVLIFRSNK